MAKRKLKEYVETGVFEIIDEWTHQWIADLPWKEAFEKYGDCDVWSSYTNASCKEPSANGDMPSWNTAVWIWIPGMHCGVSNDCPFTIPGEVKDYPGYREISFTGKRTGQKITVTEYCAYDYNVYFHNDDYSMRGETKDIYKELKEEL